MRTLLARTLPVVVSLGLLAGACSDETRDKVGDAAESASNDVENATDQAAARAAAETIRAQVELDDGDPRSVSALQDAVNDLPGDPTVSGVGDSDGDGRDDDGLVEVKVGDRYACLELPATGSDTNVSNDRCP